ncbi:EamA family transporter [Parvibaculaceae bacterium PLY_AMNH_Bact1]|nr:EamA family transporter [Parvibaculaceae bacterium PLY_AMNH_Bact1]
MAKPIDIALTAVAPAVWGSTYFVTTEFLPADHPLTMAAFRILPAGCLLLLLTPQLPRGRWWGRIFLLGILNFTLFTSLLFVAAYRLPGGVAATVGAVQPLMVVFLAALVLGSSIKVPAVFAAVMGIAGVGLLVLGAGIALDPIGLLAGVGGAAAMAAGTVLTRKWQPDVSLLTFTAWQMTAGGLCLVPLAVLFEPMLPPLQLPHIVGITYLALVGGALTYLLWFRGISRIEPSAVSALGFLSPVSAVLIGWALLDQALTMAQIGGAAMVLAAVSLGQFVGLAPRQALPYQSVRSPV